MDTPVKSGKFVINLHGGIDVFVAQLSIAARMLLAKEAEKRFPLPDPDAFKIPMPEGERLFGQPEGEQGFIPGKETTAYAEALEAARRKQSTWIDSAVLEVAVDTPQKKLLLELYTEELKALRSLSDEVPEQDWAAILKHFLMSMEDTRAVYAAISQSLPMTEEEVIDSMSYFRFRVQRVVYPGTIAKPRSSSATGPQPRETQRAVRGVPGGSEVQPDPRRNDGGPAGAELVQPVEGDTGRTDG